MRKAILVAGLAIMVVGAGLSLVHGHDVRTCAAKMRQAAQREDANGYNALVPQCNAAVQQRSLDFGIVILGALVCAASVGVEMLTSRARRDP